MPQSFKLIDKKLSQIDNEQQWVYELKIVFNYQQIIAVTTTDHYRKKLGREWITNELILEIIKERFDNKKSEPVDYSGKRKILKRETTYQGKKYRFFFWFKDNTVNHLWIRNIYPID